MVVPKAKKLTSGNWFIQLRLGGESIPVTERTEKACVAAARLIKAEYLAGRRDAEWGACSMTVGEAADRYISSRENILSPATIRGYYTIRNNRFRDVMDRPVNSISDWQGICNAEAALCSEKTLKNAWGFVASALRHAGCAVPRLTLPQVVRHESLWLEPDQIPVFTKAIEDDPCEIQMLLALHGLRISEICAVTGWDKLDMENGLIHVRGAAVPDKNHRLVQKKTNKNDASRRTVPMMIPRLKVLLDKAKQAGAPIAGASPSTVLRHVNKACAKHGLPEVGNHGLRHSFASLCYHLGLSERETMDLGGWSDAGTMRRIYIHLARKDKAKAENRIKEFYNNADEFANE